MTRTVDELHNLPIRRLLMNVFYEGPWEKVATKLWKTDQFRFAEGTDYEVEFEPKISKLRDMLGRWAEKRDVRWREKHVLAGREPHDRWKRNSSA